MTYFYLDKQGQAIECELLEDRPFARTVKLLEQQPGKMIKVHPEGVAWGQMYPRLVEHDKRPNKVFSFKGRNLTADPVDQKDALAIPSPITGYRFQPFLRDVIDSIHAKEAVILTGGTGVGKTTHITQLAYQIGQPLLRVNFNGETRMSDILGKMQVLNGQTVYSYGILPTAMMKGYWLLLDELDFADPAVLSLLHPILEEDPVLVLKENDGQIIRPHKNFRIFATANSIGAMSDRAGSYAGTTEMNEAFLDRWQVIYVDNLPAKEEVQVLRKQVPGLKAAWAKQIVSFANKARDKSLDGYGNDNFSTRSVLRWAKKVALHRAPIYGAKLSWLEKQAPDQQKVLYKVLETHFGRDKMGPLSKTKGIGRSSKVVIKKAIQKTTLKDVFA